MRNQALEPANPRNGWQGRPHRNQTHNRPCAPARDPPRVRPHIRAHNQPCTPARDPPRTRTCNQLYPEPVSDRALDPATDHAPKMSQPRSIEARLRPAWGPIGTQLRAHSGPKSAFRAIHPAKPSIRLRLIGTCPSSHARPICISPVQRLAPISYTTTSPHQTQTYPPLRSHSRPQPPNLQPQPPKPAAQPPRRVVRKRKPPKRWPSQARAFASASRPGAGLRSRNRRRPARATRIVKLPIRLRLAEMGRNSRLPIEPVTRRNTDRYRTTTKQHPNQTQTYRFFQSHNQPQPLEWCAAARLWWEGRACTGRLRIAGAMNLPRFHCRPLRRPDLCRLFGHAC